MADVDIEVEPPYDEAHLAAYPVEYMAGIDLYNAGEFHAAHDAWEERWMGEVGADEFFARDGVFDVIDCGNDANQDIIHTDQQFVDSIGANCVVPDVIDLAPPVLPATPGGGGSTAKKCKKGFKLKRGKCKRKKRK